MQTRDISFKRHRFPPQIVAHAVWLYLRFNLSLREVEEMLLERGIDVSYETVRRWIAKFGPQIARNLRRRQVPPGDIWYLDEVVVKCAGEKFWLWRAVDQHGTVLEEILQNRRDKRAAKRLLVTLMKRYGFAPKRIITDKLRSYGASIIGLKIAICRFENGNEPCKATGHQARCNDSSPCTQRPAIAFQFRPVAAPRKQFATIGSKLSMHGKLRPVSPEYPRTAELSSQRNLT
jgi:transposase-like protein